MTTLTYRLADTLSRRWGPGDEVVVSRLDHDANVRPWVQAATRQGATVRWAEVDISTAELPAAQYGELVTERTRLVAVTAASNIVGTRPDVAAIAAAAHAVGALCYVDGVHATPHVPVVAPLLAHDLQALVISAAVGCQGAQLQNDGPLSAGQLARRQRQRQGQAGHDAGREIRVFHSCILQTGFSAGRGPFILAFPAGFRPAKSACYFFIVRLEK